MAGLRGSATLGSMDLAPLRIGFVMLHTSPLDVPGTKDAGGMNVVVRAQAEALAREGQPTRIFTRRTDPDLPRYVALAPGLTVVHLDAGPAELLPKGEHESVMEEFGVALAEELERDPADILHAEHWFSGIAALPVARALGVPMVQSCHSIAADPSTPLAEGERPESPGRLAGERLLAHEADLMVAVSEAEKHTIIERLGGSAERTRVVPHGVDTELFHPGEDFAERQEWWGCGGRAEVLVVGRLHPLKGFDLAIDAVAEIPAESRPTLRIIGSPPPDGHTHVQELHDAVERHDMREFTVFEGAVRRGELAERLRAADIVLIPSHSETFGLVALEAAASGVPVIARAVGGLLEAVVDGETGILIEGGDPRAWAAAIERLLGDPGLAAEMRVAARRRALAQSWQASAALLLRVYRELLGESE